jgi:hypothetical protein
VYVHESHLISSLAKRFTRAASSLIPVLDRGVDCFAPTAFYARRVTGNTGELQEVLASDCFKSEKRRLCGEMQRLAGRVATRARQERDAQAEEMLRPALPAAPSPALLSTNKNNNLERKWQRCNGPRGGCAGSFAKDCFFARFSSVGEIRGVVRAEEL